MGGSSWSSNDYQVRLQAARSAGRDNFDYSQRVRTGKAAPKVHDLLNPLAQAGPTSPFAGKVMRESVITDEHPNPTPIVIALDVTASNDRPAAAVHAKLPQLFGVLQRTGGIEHPQIMIMAIGDATCDQYPLQAGQFESDNAIDDQIQAMILEGGGGGQNRETYELGAYFLARHTHLESVKKQGRKGYVFFIGDEMPYDRVNRSHVKNWIGDKLEADVSTKDVFAELAKTFHVYYLFQRQGSHNHMQSTVMQAWKDLIGENALVIEDPNTVPDFIAGLLAHLEGGLDVDDVAGTLTAAGFDPNSAKSVSKTLATVGGGAGGAVASTDGSLDLADSTGADRL